MRFVTPKLYNTQNPLDENQEFQPITTQLNHKLEVPKLTITQHQQPFMHPKTPYITTPLAFHSPAITQPRTKYQKPKHTITQPPATLPTPKNTLAKTIRKPTQIHHNTSIPSLNRHHLAPNEIPETQKYHHPTTNNPSRRSQNLFRQYSLKNTSESTINNHLILQFLLH